MQGGKDNERKHGRAKRENVIIWYRFPDSRTWDAGGGRVGVGEETLIVNRVR